ncbi:hypothetical protein D3C73_1406180 [compost metagenome]
MHSGNGKPNEHRGVQLPAAETGIILEFVKKKYGGIRSQTSDGDGQPLDQRLIMNLILQLHGVHAHIMHHGNPAAQNQAAEQQSPCSQAGHCSNP